MSDTNKNSKNLEDCSSCSSCSYCSSCKGLRMSENMIFCLGEGQYESKGIGYQQNNMVFNKKVTPEEFIEIKNSLPKIELAVSSWVDKKNMTDEEKEDVSGWSEMSEYLKTLSYEQAWAKWWSEAKSEDKEKILNIPGFDSKIFTAITGITDFKSKSLKGKKVKVTFDNVEYSATID